MGGHIKQLNMKGKLYDIDMVEEKMGVKPHKILDLLALTGDASDNIPGVPSVGPKTAAKWLQLYGDIKGVKANANKIDGKVGEKLRESFDLLNLSYQLVELKFDVNLPFNVFDDEPGESTEELRELYTEYGFSMWLKQLADQVKEKPITKTIEPLVNQSQDQKSTLLLQEFTQTLILKQADFESLLKQLSECASFVFDLETNSLDYMNAEDCWASVFV